VHDIPVGLSQRAYFAETFADLAVKCSVKTANESALGAVILDFFDWGTAISAALLADIPLIFADNGPLPCSGHQHIQ
jgi:hypothetical protein